MDLNNDGYGDILSGSYSRMEKAMAGLFQVLWGERGGKFKEAAVLNGTDGKPLIIPIKSKDEQLENICTRPTAVDWNGDGKLDLVVGNFGGTLYLFKGEGSGKFAPKPEPLMTGGTGTRLKIEGHHSDPFVVDWDGDGDLDVLSGSDQGGVQWAENTAGKGKTPALKEFKTIIEKGPSFNAGELISEEDLKVPCSGTRVWADDVNGDGKLDLLVGDDATVVTLAKGVTKKQHAAKLEKWEEACTAAHEAMGKAVTKADKEATRKRYNEVYEKRKEFVQEASTGFVWLYKRK